MNHTIRWLSFCLLIVGFSASSVFAQDSNGNTEDDSTQATTETEPPAEASPDAAGPSYSAEGFDSANTAWMLICSALVLMMTAPGLALFYGGLVRKKNILGVMMQCVFLMGTMSIVWALWGYSLAFGDHLMGGFIGDGKFLLMNNVLPYYDTDLATAVYPMAGSIPEMVNMVFQMMFFIITPCLICGAFAERMKFSAMVVFSILWGTFVYCPIAHWVWGGGYFSEGQLLHAFDFAGGTVVHISSGVSALLCAIIIGKRLGFNQEPMPPHNLTYTCIGAALLWVGWFGFNAGSAVAADVFAANAFVATHLAASGGVIAWAGAEWYFRGKPSILGACSGAVAGLVCITPASGTVTPLSGIILGLIAGLACFWACTSLKSKFGYDDSLDAFGVHGVGGTVGALLTGVFATRAVTGDDHAIGLLEGNAAQMGPQLISIIAAGGIAVIGTFIILKVIDATIGLRVSQQDEIQGLDLSQHGEEGYIFL